MNLLIISTFKSYKIFQHVLISFILNMVSVIVSILVVVFFSIGMSHTISYSTTYISAPNNDNVVVFISYARFTLAEYH